VAEISYPTGQPILNLLANTCIKTVTFNNRYTKVTNFDMLVVKEDEISDSLDQHAVLCVNERG
jgi:hypothetical protein